MPMLYDYKASFIIHLNMLFSWVNQFKLEENQKQTALRISETIFKGTTCLAHRACKRTLHEVPASVVSDEICSTNVSA
jgi:hypothetical protein